MLRQQLPVEPFRNRADCLHHATLLPRTQRALHRRREVGERRPALRRVDGARAEPLGGDALRAPRRRRPPGDGDGPLAVQRGK